WYDDSMERVSGAYRRRVGAWLWVWAIVLVLALNADTVQIARTLWTDAPVRAAVVAQAQQAADNTQAGTSTQNAVTNLQNAAQNVADLNSIDVPLGWSLQSGDPQNVPRNLKSIVVKIIGLMLTALALTVGAPF